MVSAKEWPIQVEPNDRRAKSDGFLTPLEDEEYEGWDGDIEPGAPFIRRHRDGGDWHRRPLKATIKGLVWFMDTMCLGLCPWVKKF